MTPVSVARDAKFQQILVSIPLGDKQEYLINLPETAVYFARVRHQSHVVWQEGLFALLSSTAEERMPRLSWSSVPQAGRYRLWLARFSLRTRWFETPETAVHLNKVGAP